MVRVTQTLSCSFFQTTSKGQSYFNAYDEYLEWEKFISTVKESLRKDSPLDTMYQTSEFWTKVSLFTSEVEDEKNTERIISWVISVCIRVVPLHGNFRLKFNVCGMST